MKELIACCGIDCETCEARIAMVNDDDALRAVVAAKWSEMYQAPGIVAASINCTGCRAPGVKFSHCETTCEIRKCSFSKGYATCGDCPDVESCPIVAFILQEVPGTRANLGLEG